jgi:hypothetical protein
MEHLYFPQLRDKENSLVGTAPDASYYLFITEDDTSENPVEKNPFGLKLQKSG